MCRHWSGDILDLLFAHIVERKLKLVANLIAHRATHADASRLCQRLKTGRYVDTVAKDVFVINNDIANIQANAKLDPPFRGDSDVSLRHLPLNVDSAAYSVDNAGKLNKDAVSRRLDNAPAVFCDLGVDHCASVTLERGQRPFFIKAHQPRITRNIPRKNGR
jgi:hypothetical protein